MSDTTTKVQMDALMREAGIADCRGRGDGEFDCLACGRGMTYKQLGRASIVHISTDRHFVPLAYDGEDSQGGHDIGATCAAKLRKALKARGLNPKDYVEKIHPEVARRLAEMYGVDAD